MCADLTAQTRDRIGKGAARAVRREGQVPAVIYGDSKPPISISLLYKDVEKKIYSGGFLSTVLAIDVEGEEHRVIPRDYQLEPVRDFIMHVDFLRVTKNTVLNVEVPVSFINEDDSPGLKRGGVLNVVRHTVELACPANDIPEQLEADLTGLDVGDGIHISAIKLPESAVPTITDRDFTVATIAAPSVLRSQDNAEGGAAEGAEDDTDNDVATEE